MTLTINGSEDHFYNFSFIAQTAHLNRTIDFLKNFNVLFQNQCGWWIVRRRKLDASDSIAEEGVISGHDCCFHSSVSHAWVLKWNVMESFVELKSINKWIRNLFILISQGEPL